MTYKEDFEAYCKRYADAIYVREKIDGKWQSVALSSLSKEKQQEWITMFYEARQLPTRLIYDIEKVNLDD